MSACRCRATASLGSRRCGEIAHATGCSGCNGRMEPLWKAQDGKEGEVTFM